MIKPAILEEKLFGLKKIWAPQGEYSLIITGHSMGNLFEINSKGGHKSRQTGKAVSLARLSMPDRKCTREN